MAVEVSVVSTGVTLLLNNGTTASGTVKTKNLKLGGSSQAIDTAAYNSDLSTSRQNVIYLAAAIAPCLSKSVFRVHETTINNLAG